MPALLQRVHDEHLVGGRVLGQQHLQRRPGVRPFEQVLAARRGVSARSALRRRVELRCASICSGTVNENALPLPGSLRTRAEPAHRADQLRGDRQAQPGAAVPRRGRGIDLRERRENALLVLRRDADARVGDREPQPRLAVAGRLELRRRASRGRAR